MQKEKLWLKFIISGKPEDYINYANANKTYDESKVNGNSLFDGRIGDKGKEYR